MKNEYEAELAALREDLRMANGYCDAEQALMQSKLTAAQQRNAELAELLRDAACAVKGHAMTAWAVPLYIRINKALAHNPPNREVRNDAV